MRVGLISLILLLGCSGEDSHTRRADLQPRAPHLAIPDIDVLSYDIDLTFAEFAHGEIPARARLEVKLLRADTEIRLHVDQSTIDIANVLVNGASAEHEVEQAVAGNHGLHGDELRVVLPEPVAAGATVDIAIDYSIRTQSHSDRGLLFRKRYEGRPIFVTRSWPYYARFWLPSNDHPSDPATFDITLHVPAGAVGAANGKLAAGTPAEGEGLEPNGLRLFRWQQSTPLPVYGVVVAVAELDVISRELCFRTNTINADLIDCAGATHRVPMSFYIQPSNRDREAFLEAADAGARSLVLFSSMLEPYVYDKLGFVTAPQPFNMEGVSMIVMVSSEATVHEVAHHWWGNTVYIGHWGDLWISEGFTTYFTGLFDEFEGGKNTACKQKEGRLSAPANTDPLAIFDDTPYCKGASALADLRMRLGKLAGFDTKSAGARNLFFDLSRALFRAHRFQRLTTEGLLAWLRDNVSGICARRGKKVSADKVDAMLTAWHQQWFSP